MQNLINRLYIVATAGRRASERRFATDVSLLASHYRTGAYRNSTHVLVTVPGNPERGFTTTRFSIPNMPNLFLTDAEAARAQLKQLFDALTGEDVTVEYNGNCPDCGEFHPGRVCAAEVETNYH